MLDHAADSARTARPDLSELIDRLTQDGKRWVEAEMAMARLEMADLKTQVAKMLAFSILGFAAGVCALVSLSQAAIAFLTPYVDSAGLAALLVAALLLIVVTISYFCIRGALAWQAESILFRWFSPGSQDAERT